MAAQVDPRRQAQFLSILSPGLRLVVLLFAAIPDKCLPAPTRPTSGVTGITYFCAAPIHLRVDRQTEGCYDETNRTPRR